MAEEPAVWNKRIGYPESAVYVGRGSKWGNPFRIGATSRIDKGLTRAEVIEKYREHLQVTGLIEQVGELTGKDLVCWCSPEACHGDVLLELANTPEMIELAKES